MSAPRRGFSTKTSTTSAIATTVRFHLRLAYRYEGPTTNECGKKLATADVDVFGAERHQIVCSADRIRRDIDPKRDDDQADCCKRSRSSPSMRSRVKPIADDYDGIPLDFAVSRLGASGSEDSEKTNDSEDAGNDNCLNIDCARLVGISSKICDVKAQRCVVSENAIQICEPGLAHKFRCMQTKVATDLRRMPTRERTQRSSCLR